MIAVAAMRIIVTEMTPDDRADVLEDLEEERADEILAKIPAAEREEVVRSRCRHG